MKTKFCSICCIEHDISEFGINKASKDGLTACCKKERNKRTKEQKAQNPNKYKYPEAYQKYYKNNRDDVIKRSTERNKNNLEKTKQYKDKYREKHREEYNKKNKEWVQNHPIERAFSVYKSSARKRNILFELTYEQFSSLYDKNCFYCGEKLDTIRLDRLDPNCSYNYCNVVSCCSKCNYFKNILNINQFWTFIYNITFHNFGIKLPIDKHESYETKSSMPKKELKIKARFRHYVKGANRKNAVSWNLDLEQFEKFWQKPCFYCGNPIETIGLDRINNYIGYCESNVVSCCKTCNFAKGNKTTEEFFERLFNIVKNKFNICLVLK